MKVMHFTRILNTQTKTDTLKKRGDWLLPVPHLEALRLPCSQERATIEPHVDMHNKLSHFSPY